MTVSDVQGTEVSPKQALESSVTITVDDAAELLGIGRNAAYAAVKAGEIPSIRIGGRIRIPTAPLRRMLGIDGREPRAPNTALA